MKTLNKELLVALLDFAQSDVPASVAGLAEATGRTRREVAEGLNELDQLGLVRGEKVRLTLLGLAKAAACRVRAARARKPVGLAA